LDGVVGALFVPEEGDADPFDEDGKQQGGLRAELEKSGNHVQPIEPAASVLGGDVPIQE
jgi:hypothetical protein